MTTAYILIDVVTGLEEKVLANLSGLTNDVVEARAVIGVHDIFVKVQCLNVDQMMATLAIIRKVEGVVRTNTLQAIPEYGGLQK